MYSAVVITVSDRCSRGERMDEAGPKVEELLKGGGYELLKGAVVPDDMEAIAAELVRCADVLGAALIVTTGGTGFSPRDVTPEATLSVIERAAPGIPEAMRLKSLAVTERAMLSRATAGIRGRSLIINLPGSPRAAGENLLAVIDALSHGLSMLRGGVADCAAQAARNN